MAISRGLSTIAMSVSSDESHFGRPRSVSRSDSQSSSDSSSSSSSSGGGSSGASTQQRGMPIHSRRAPNVAPPPLPPPQYIEELDRGQDIGYELANSVYRPAGALPTIREGSSLRGGAGAFSRPGQPRNYKHFMDVDDEAERRVSNSIMVQPSHAEGGASTRTPKLPRRAHSPSTSNTMLQGELPLAQESHDRSNRDYDHAMLSKIGKPNSPPRPSRPDSSDSPVLAQKLSLQTKDVKPQRLPTNEPTSAVGSVAQWITSPSPTGVSPGSRYGWPDQSGPRSPPTEPGAGTLALDPELFVPRSTNLQSTNGPSSSVEEAPNRSARNSYDHAMYTPAESETTTEDSSFRGFSMDEPYSAQRRTSGAGMKRKALSPPGDRQSEDRSRQDLYPLRMRVTSKSPNTHYPSNSGSISSAASSAQPQSYASSGLFSAAPSSMTSMSSFDPNSPREQSIQSTYITSAQPVASPISSISVRKVPEKLVPRKLSTQTAVMSPRPLPTRIGNNYICACCAKKPKKFETEEQLKAHENEKQYSCNFCHNRFKNKNEAERHQNSLHLRRHSWSCAALANYEAAFSPSGAVDSSSTATDACGYCGEEFPNHPAPDWDRRIEHLTNVHKFGECNSAKKFFRADHFRQHLKHSHAGRSGKWTNILEHACVRDEIPTDPAGYPTSTGDHNPVAQTPGPSGTLGPAELPIGGAAAHGPQADAS